MVMPLNTPSHCLTSSGLVYASNTMCLGASNSRDISIVRSPGVASFILPTFLIGPPPSRSRCSGTPALAGSGQLRPGLHALEHAIEALEALLPVLAVLLEPLVGLGERPRLEPTRPALRVAAA